MISEIKIPADIGHMRDAMDFLVNYAKTQGISEKKIGEIQLIAEEILVNIIHYAYPEKNGFIEINCHKDNQKQLMIRFADNGVPFDPLKKEPPNIHLDMDERSIGGLGIYLVRELAKDLTYRRKDNQNILTVTIGVK